MRKILRLLIISFIVITSAKAQDNNTEKLKIFVEGRTEDFNYMRNSTPFVDFVNDPKVSDVHVIITRQNNGGGGRLFSLQFYGPGFPDLQGFKITCHTYSFDTDQSTREKLVKTLHSGLLPYVNEKQGMYNLRIVSEPDDANSENYTATNTTVDPWRRWVFEIGAQGGFGGEERKNNIDYQFDAEASKTTNKWKIRNQYEYEKEQRTVEKDDGEKINSLKIDQDADVRFVYSLTPHWSAGVFLQGTQSTYRNQKMILEAKPALQYNYYDWKESDRRRLTFTYDIGPTYNLYYDTTIFNVSSEFLWKESLEIKLEKVETWGEINVWLEGGHFFPDFQYYYFQTGMDLSFRVTRGLSVNFRIETESIHNQRYLSASGLSDEELFLNIRKLPTTFEYYGRLGLRFQFGSIFNNVVNQRL